MGSSSRVALVSSLMECLDTVFYPVFLGMLRDFVKQKYQTSTCLLISRKVIEKLISLLFFFPFIHMIKLTHYVRRLYF